MSQGTHLPHITNYKLVAAGKPEELGTKVDAAIHDGWQPYGSMAIEQGGESVVYVQPVVKYAEWYA